MSRTGNDVQETSDENVAQEVKAANGCACSQEVCDGKDVSGGLQRGDHSADEQVVHEVRQLRHSVEILQRQNKKLRLFCQALEGECQDLHTNIQRCREEKEHLLQLSEALHCQLELCCTLIK